MSHAELEHLAILAEIDDLVRRVRQWSARVVPWAPAGKVRSVVSHIIDRVHLLRIRLESPLVVATFGGTGTGKSTLVNALVGQEVTQSGRQRPTTTIPVLLIHPDLEVSALGLDLSQFHVRRIDAPVLRDLILIDCPDPDTSEGASAGSNLAVLRTILPHCDVLLYVSTQQKYRSARISDELADAAAGCRLVFVQTHADQDSDIREDWMQCLSDAYQIPEMFFVDSRRAFQEQVQGTRPGGDFGRLLQLLTNQLGTSKRVAIRRANLIDLLEDALEAAHIQYQAGLPDVRKLQEVLDEQRHHLRTKLIEQLRDELLMNRNLWERRLLSAITNLWGFSPFSAVLRFYNGLGAFIASLTFFRARTSAQMVLIGALQGARWIKSKAEESDADSSLERVAAVTIPDQQLQEARVIVSGYLQSAGIEHSDVTERRGLTELRLRAARVEGMFLNDARRMIDDLIEQLARIHSGLRNQCLWEILFLVYPAFLIGRIGHNFFWTSFLAPIIGRRTEAAPLLSIDFYVPALLFFVLWSGTLAIAFTRRLKQGLSLRIHQLAESLVDDRISEGLFPELEQICGSIVEEDQQLSALLESTTAFRRHLSDSAAFLGGQKHR